MPQKLQLGGQWKVVKIGRLHYSLNFLVIPASSAIWNLFFVWGHQMTKVEKRSGVGQGQNQKWKTVTNNEQRGTGSSLDVVTFYLIVPVCSFIPLNIPMLGFLFN